MRERQRETLEKGGIISAGGGWEPRAPIHAGPPLQASGPGWEPWKERAENVVRYPWALPWREGQADCLEGFGGCRDTGQILSKSEVCVMVRVFLFPGPGKEVRGCSVLSSTLSSAQCSQNI